MTRKLALAALAIWSAACANDIAAPRRDALLSLDPSFVRFNSDAYTVADKSGSFWAVAGQGRELILRYSDTNDDFLRFKVDGESLKSRPDGTAFQEGDSILITVNVADDGTMRFHFEPSGLQFSNDHPAELRISTKRSNLGLLQSLSASIYRRDLPLAPWLKLPTLHLTGDEFESYVQHFTDFGMAVN